MKISIFKLNITIEKRESEKKESEKKEIKEAFGAHIGWWYRIPGDSTDKVRLVYKKNPEDSKRCIKCHKEIREGLVWDTHFVTPGIFNTFLDAPICTECGSSLSSVLNSLRST